MGVHGDDIWIYDAIRSLPNRFVSRGPTDVHYFDNGCHENAGWSNHNISFNPPSGGSVANEILPEMLVSASYLINMPIMKGHPIGGVSLGYKNHFGTINAPGDLHNWIDAVGGTSRTNYNPMVDFYHDPHIGGKTVLTIGDGLFAARQFNQPPQVWETFGYKVPNSLFFATDPVAVDCVMHDFVAAEVSVPAEANRYLRLGCCSRPGRFRARQPVGQRQFRV